MCVTCAVISIPAIYKIIEECESGLSFMTVFVGLSGTSEVNGLKSQNTWAFPRSIRFHF